MAGAGLFDLDEALVAVVLPCDGRYAALSPESVTLGLAQGRSLEGRLRALYGLRVVPLDDAVRTHLGAESGVLVSEVWTGFAGDLAGLRPGDVIVGLDGTRVASPEDLQPLLSPTEQAEAVLGVWRARQRREIRLVARALRGAAPPGHRRGPGAGPRPSRRGLPHRPGRSRQPRRRGRHPRGRPSAARGFAAPANADRSRSRAVPQGPARLRRDPERGAALRRAPRGAMNELSSLGLILLLALGAGHLVKFARIPEVSGYLVAGIVLGPSVLGWVSQQNLTALEILSEVALGLILFSVGTVFELSRFRRVGRQVLLLTLVESALAAVIVSAGMLLLGQSWKTAFLLGAIAVATAPASTLMVVRENDSAGPLTDSLLAIIALNNIYCIIAFSLVGAAIDLASGLDGPAGLFPALYASLYPLVWQLVGLGGAGVPGGDAARRAGPPR